MSSEVLFAWQPPPPTVAGYVGLAFLFLFSLLKLFFVQQIKYKREQLLQFLQSFAHFPTTTEAPAYCVDLFRLESELIYALYLKVTPSLVVVRRKEQW